jgi:hypothetical protein
MAKMPTLAIRSFGTVEVMLTGSNSLPTIRRAKFCRLGVRESFGTDDDICGKLCGLVELFWRFTPKREWTAYPCRGPMRHAAVTEVNFPAKDRRYQ